MLTHYFDPEHQAQWGQTSSEALTLLGNAAATYQADMALIHIGTNDLALDKNNDNAQDGDVSGASASIDSIITKLLNDVSIECRMDRLKINLCFNFIVSVIR